MVNPTVSNCASFLARQPPRIAEVTVKSCTPCMKTGSASQKWTIEAADTALEDCKPCTDVEHNRCTRIPPANGPLNHHTHRKDVAADGILSTV